VGTVVLLRAILKGMGREVECEVIAWRSPADAANTASSLSKCSRYSVLNVPSDLPDGEYTIHLDSQVIPTLRRRGLWL
jgi:hypothetical protein